MTFQAKGGGDMSSSGFAARAQSAADRNANTVSYTGGALKGSSDSQNQDQPKK